MKKGYIFGAGIGLTVANLTIVPILIATHTPYIINSILLCLGLSCLIMSIKD